MSERPEDWDSSRDEIISGEYVLGVLSEADRRKVEERMAVDERFSRQVRRWQRNLSQFNEDYQDQPVPADLFRKIEVRLFEPAVDETKTSMLRWLWSSASFWRAAFGVTLLAGVIGLSVDRISARNERPAPAMVAELSSNEGGLRLLASYDASTGLLNISPAAQRESAPKSLEVWVIGPDQVPISVGILAEGSGGNLNIPESLRQKVSKDVVVAITLETFGGSPDGKPHGPVVASGKMQLL